MKSIIAALLLVSASQAIKLEQKGDDIWAETLSDLNVKEYTNDNPQGYYEKEKPKPDPKVMAALVQKEKEKARKQALDELKAEENAKTLEDMNLELYTFAKTLKTSSFHKALALKQKLEENGAPPKHFRVATHNLWMHSFKHDALPNYAFVKEKMADLDIAEKNLNRNIDSKPQLEMFLKVAMDVKDSFLKRYGEEEWQP